MSVDTTNIKQTKEDDLYNHYQNLVEGENINQQTLLATDYLNHFNEVHMLLDMLVDMPDCLEDVQEWGIKSYSQHFMESSFSAKELAIEAYNHSPKQFKVPFEKTVDSMNKLVLETISKSATALMADKLSDLGKIIAFYKPKMEGYIEECSAIINGTKHIAHQEDIDSYFQESAKDENTSAQSSIDDLFS